jgi:hypothetical protein
MTRSVPSGNCFLGLWWKLGVDLHEQLRQMHFQRNRETADLFQRYSHHRQMVTGLLLDAASKHSGLAVLGAGNSNDLDLSQLQQHFSRILLVDLDELALREGLRRQQSSQDVNQSGDRKSNIELLPDIDLAGIMRLIPKEATTPLMPDQADDLSTAIEARQSQSGVALPDRFDVVASTCLLSQVADTLIHLLGADHPRLLSVILAIRREHFRLLLESTLPGGTAILINDFVSSDTWPGLAQTPEHLFQDECIKQLALQNFFNGMNPLRFQYVPSESPSIANLCADIQLSAFWVWQMRVKAFAVCACIMRRRDRKDKWLGRRATR